MDYGTAIKKARALRSMSQNQLAERAGLDTSYVSFIETGRRVPSTKALESIADALNVPLYLLVLMASGEQELRGVPKTEADQLASALLKLILDGEHEV